MRDSTKRLEEINKRFLEIDKEIAGLREEREAIFKEEIEEMFNWELLKSLEWHVAYPFTNKLTLRAIFKNELREKFKKLQELTSYCYSHKLIINGYDIDIGSQALVLLNIPYTEYIKLSKILKIVNVHNREEKKMLRKTIEHLERLEKL